MRAKLAALALIATLAGSNASSAADKQTNPSALQALERQVVALKEEVQRLKAAMAKAAELTRRSAETLVNSVAGTSPTQSDPSNPRRRSAAPKKRRATIARGTVRGTVQVPSGEPIAYAYIENIYAPPVKGKTVVIDQKDKRFTPSWAVVRRGTKIEFPNRDNIHHNVFSPSAGNAFDLGLYSSGAPAKAHTFQSAGSADIYCNIHPKMAASVLVVPNRYFARVRPDGTFVIRNVPVGQRKLVAWSPSSHPTVEWVRLTQDSTVNVKLMLESKSGVHKDKSGRAYGSYP